MTPSEQDPPLEELLNKFAGPEPVAQVWWDALHRRLRPLILGICFRVLRGERESAEDACQEAFLRIFRHCPFAELQDPRVFRSYVATLAYRTAIDSLRRLHGRREAPRATRLEAVPEVHDPRQVPPLQQAEQREFVEQVLGHLDEADRHMLRLLLEGYAFRDIVAQIGLSYAAAAGRLHRLREALRKYLRQPDVR